MSKIPDRYEIQAQYTPAILCSVPFIFFGIFFLARIDLSFWPKLFSLGVGGVTLSVSLYQLYAHTCQIAGKLLESFIFKDGLEFPTTEYLLKSDHNLTNDYKKQILEKIKAKYKVDLSDKTDDTPENRRRINEVIAQVRQPFWKTNPMVLQRNIQFGFAKNLAGGSIVASFASLILLGISLISQNHTAIDMSSIFVVIYVLFSLIFTIVIRFRAKYYALTLFNEFLVS